MQLERTRPYQVKLREDILIEKRDTLGSFVRYPPAKLSIEHVYLEVLMGPLVNDNMSNKVQPRSEIDMRIRITITAGDLKGTVLTGTVVEPIDRNPSCAAFVRVSKNHARPEEKKEFKIWVEILDSETMRSR